MKELMAWIQAKLGTEQFTRCETQIRLSVRKCNVLEKRQLLRAKDVMQRTLRMTIDGPAT